MARALTDSGVTHRSVFFFPLFRVHIITHPLCFSYCLRSQTKPGLISKLAWLFSKHVLKLLNCRCFKLTRLLFCRSLRTGFWRMPMSFIRCPIPHLLRSYRICGFPTVRCLSLSPPPLHPPPRLLPTLYRLRHHHPRLHVFQVSLRSSHKLSSLLSTSSLLVRSSGYAIHPICPQVVFPVK